MAESSAHILASIHPSPTAGDPSVARWVCVLLPLPSVSTQQRIFLMFGWYIVGCLLTYLHNNATSMKPLNNYFDWYLFRESGRIGTVDFVVLFDFGRRRFVMW
jgi:hypothetical protein